MLTFSWRLPLLLICCLWLAASPLAAQEQSPAGRAQTLCPVMGGQIDKNLYVDYQGQRIYFCCAACIPLFKKDPQAYLKKMKDAGVAPEKTPAKQ